MVSNFSSNSLQESRHSLKCQNACRINCEEYCYDIQAIYIYTIYHFDPILLTGRVGKREEGQVPHLPTSGFGSGSGLPRLGALCFQPEISVEPQSGEGKSKYHLIVC